MIAVPVGRLVSATLVPPALAQEAVWPEVGLCHQSPVCRVRATVAVVSVTFVALSLRVVKLSAASSLAAAQVLALYALKV